MDNLFSIGELADYQNISKQTLIYYDKIGLFRPAWVDPDNGYRYYSAKQIDYLDTILIMKKAGFSLNEIREHMQNYNIDSSLSILGKQISVINRQIQQLQLIQSRLSHRCRQIEKARIYMDTESAIMLEEAEERYILTRKVEEPYSLREISIAAKQCFSYAFEKNLPVFFQCGVIVPLERIRAGRFVEASDAFLSVEKTEQMNEQIRLLPAGQCVCTYHIGNYLSIGQSYTKLLDYCEANSLQIISDSYEFCINDHITTDDEDEYITKIMFYIRR
uniref:MerR family transcriptional regulator n=1 Tax=Lachnoclostridium phocaeense TaxID=1871021 RepID=UPI0026DB44FE|nr:MerR family transcriptional regulator [Lachnoclostridium phocaeense]